MRDVENIMFPLVFNKYRYRLHTVGIPLNDWLYNTCSSYAA